MIIAFGGKDFPLTSATGCYMGAAGTRQETYASSHVANNVFVFSSIIHGTGSVQTATTGGATGTAPAYGTEFSSVIHSWNLPFESLCIGEESKLEKSPAWINYTSVTSYMFRDPGGIVSGSKSTVGKTVAYPNVAASFKEGAKAYFQSSGTTETYTYAPPGWPTGFIQGFYVDPKFSKPATITISHPKNIVAAANIILTVYPGVRPLLDVAGSGRKEPVTPNGAPPYQRPLNLPIWLKETAQNMIFSVQPNWNDVVLANLQTSWSWTATGSAESVYGDALICTFDGGKCTEGYECLPPGKAQTFRAFFKETKAVTVNTPGIVRTILSATTDTWLIGELPESGSFSTLIHNPAEYASCCGGCLVAGPSTVRIGWASKNLTTTMWNPASPTKLVCRIEANRVINAKQVYSQPALGDSNGKTGMKTVLNAPTFVEPRFFRINNSPIHAPYVHTWVSTFTVSDKLGKQFSGTTTIKSGSSTAKKTITTAGSWWTTAVMSGKRTLEQYEPAWWTTNNNGMAVSTWATIQYSSFGAPTTTEDAIAYGTNIYSPNVAFESAMLGPRWTSGDYGAMTMTKGLYDTNQKSPGSIQVLQTWGAIKSGYSSFSQSIVPIPAATMSFKYSDKLSHFVDLSVCTGEAIKTVVVAPMRSDPTAESVWYRKDYSPVLHYGNVKLERPNGLFDYPGNWPNVLGAPDLYYLE